MTSELSYPVKMKWKSKAILVVEFTDVNTGTVIESDNNMYPVGWNSSAWQDATNHLCWEIVEETASYDPAQAGDKEDDI